MMSVWHLAGNVVALAALLWFAWAWRFRDGARRRSPRCPRCWYDMQVVGASRCPECGHAIKHPRELHRRRACRRAAAIALPMLALAYGLWTTPRVQQAGWVGAVPTTALIAVSPWIQPSESDYWDIYNSRVPASTYPLFCALLDRVKRNELNGLQWRILAEICLRKDALKAGPEQPLLSAAARALLLHAKEFDRLGTPRLQRKLNELTRVSVRARDSWPVGIPLQLAIEVECPMGSRSSRLDFRSRSSAAGSFVHHEWRSTFVGQAVAVWDDDLVAAPFSAAAGRAVMDYDVEVYEQDREDRGGWLPRCRRRVSIPILVVDSVEQILSAVESDEIGRSFFQDDWAPEFSCEPDSADGWWEWNRLRIQPDEEVLRHLGDVTVAVTIEIARNGEPMFVGMAWWALSEKWSPEGHLLPVGNVGSLQRVTTGPIPSDGCWEINLRGDPVVALRNFDGSRYWKGEITMPLYTHFGVED